MKSNKKEVYEANFLWPHDNNSIEQAGYEFANARTEEYRHEWWGILVAMIGSKFIDIGLCAGQEIGRVEVVNFCEKMGFHAHSEPHLNLNIIMGTIAEWLYYYDLSRSGSLDADQWIDLPDSRRQEYKNVVPDLIKFLKNRNKKSE